MGKKISFRDAKIEFSTDGTTWVDASGVTNRVDISGGGRSVSEFFAPNSDTPILTTGKRAALELTLNVAFENPGSGSVWEMVLNAYEGNGAFWVRWSPAGGNSGDERFVADPGIVTSPVYPPGDASSADMVVMDFTVKTPKITREQVP